MEAHVEELETRLQEALSDSVRSTEQLRRALRRVQFLEARLHTRERQLRDAVRRLPPRAPPPSRVSDKEASEQDTVLIS